MHNALRSAPLLLTAALGLCLSLAATGAENDCVAPSPDCVEVGQLNLSVSMGAGTRTNPVEGNSDIPLVLVPQFSYYGKHFFVENLELGLTLHEGNTSTLNLIVTPGYDRVFFYEDDPQNVVIPLLGTDTAARVPVGERHTTFLVGPEWLIYYGKLTGQLVGLYEVSGEHDGYEVRGAVSAPLHEGTGSWVMSAGFTWKSTEIVRYYYGVEDFYEPGSALNPFVKLAYYRPLSDRWAFNASAHYEHLGNAVADSPFISDPGVATVFAGFAYKIL